MFISEKHFRNDFFEFKIEKGILRCTYTCDELTLEVVQIMYEARTQIMQGKRYKTIADARRTKKMSKEARDFMAGKDTPQEFIAGALLVSNNIQKMVGNMLLYFNRFAFPFRIFTDEKSALQWLRKIKE
jgi:hypothetical protein